MKNPSINDYMKQYRTTHTQLVASIPAELAAHLKDQLKKDGLSYTKFLINAIQDYLNKKGD